MSYSERKYNRPLSFGQRSNALILLISINLVIFVILAFVRAIFFMRYENNVEADSLFQSQVLKWFVLPADIHEIGTRPWTIITHMFTHSDVWHVLGKYVVAMGFWLHLTRPHGNRKIFPVFLYGAFGGAIAYVLAINFLPALEKNLPYAVALGASRVLWLSQWRRRRLHLVIAYSPCSMGAYRYGSSLHFISSLIWQIFLTAIGEALCTFRRWVNRFFIYCFFPAGVTIGAAG
ncbi:MAG: rhomboid family intramembrane serine protease [Chitinophagaceae bacterium]